MFAHKALNKRSLAIAAIALSITGVASAQGQWLNGGGDFRNTRSSSDTTISAANAANLGVKWVYTTAGDVSATPTVSEGRVYDVDFGGNVFCVDANTGAQVWSNPVGFYTNNPWGSFSRTSPAVAGSNVIIGDQGDFNPANPYTTGFFPTSLIMGTDPTGNTASLIAINKYTGAPAWRTVIDPHQWSMITCSPVVYNGVVYVGVCSFEEAGGLLGPWFTASFRGSVVAVDANTGAILWKTYTVPAGYTGGAVWGSTPAVDANRGVLYAATGNNYTVPASVEAQIAADPAHGLKYLAPNDYVDSVLALNLADGSIKWGDRLQGSDTWNIVRDSTTDDPAKGPDYDFGSGPNLYSLGKNNDRVGAGEKSGVYWSIKPDSGVVQWKTQVGPGGTTGGIQWGSATDGNQVYVGVTNSKATPYKIKNQTYTCGSWAALNASDGSIKWQIPDPKGGRCYSMITVANGVMYAGSTTGDMYAINTANGSVLWSFASGGSTICGPAVVDGTVYWGSGYGRFFGSFGTGNNKLYAFSLQSPSP